MSKQVRTVIVDDEPLARQTIRMLLKDVDGAEVVAECSNGQDALQAVTRLSPDLLFLDIQMPEMNGFEVLERLNGAEVPAVIFVTAYDRYALKAFEVHALDYLLKPFDDERFHEAVDRALDHLQSSRESLLGRRLMALLGDYRAHLSAAPSGADGSLKKIAIKSQGRISFVPAAEIDWVEAADQYVMIHADRESHLVRESMSGIEAQLPAGLFVRIHRSSLVNIRRVRELKTGKLGESCAVLQNGTVLKVSRNRKAALQEALSR